MGTTGHESILVGIVVHSVPHTIIANILVETLGTESLTFGVPILNATRFGHLGILFGQVPVVVTVIVVLLDLFLDAIESATFAALGGNRGECGSLDLLGWSSWGSSQGGC